MRQVQFSETGGADVLKVVDVVRPEPGPNQVLVRVESASVNFADVVRRRGDPYPAPTPLPAVPGSEVAGFVEAVGENVEDLAVGDPVFGSLDLGGYSEFVITESERTFKLPEDFDLDVACTLVVAGVTAYQIITEVARVNVGDSVFIPGAVGGVGSYAVQIARIQGAKLIIAGASSNDRRAQALANGADYAVDYGLPSWPDEVKKLTDGKGADVVLDMIGGDHFEQCLAALAPFGRLVVYGNVSRQSATLKPTQLLGLGQSVAGYYVGQWFAARPVESHRAFRTLVGLVQARRLKVEISEKFPLERAADAHRLIEQRRAIGKTILKPWA
ncbi:NADPH:quinone oxidoreductase family protein [Mesorhizobium sp. DCY119]|uniref:quinone oxidoreductase family protein n=1 Tax=Mesorhizobium sp. DCY119 TaxID=2108445 RepID=UPI0014034AE1|nr:NADPH:quinone oxidoreductase family protein [Mesorhizobium sp. DCY119]